MKILIVAPEFPPLIGGGATYVAQLSKVLQGQGIDVVVLTGGESDTLADYGRERVYRRTSFSIDNRPLALTSHMIDDFYEVMKKELPDIIHAQHTAAILLCEAVWNVRPIRCVYTQHKTPEWPVGYRKLDGKGTLALLASKIAGTVDHALWVAPSYFFARKLVSDSVPCGVIDIVYPSVNASLFSPKVTDTQVASEKYIFMSAVDRPRKDIPFLLEALRGTGIAAYITGVKDKTEAYNKYARLFSDVNIIRHDYVSDAALVGLMQKSLACIMTSTHEGLGLSAIEAILVGSNVFLRNAPGLNEVAELYPVKMFSSPDELRDLIINAKSLSLEDMKRQHSEAEMVFSENKQAEKHIDVYTRAMKHEFSAGGICIYNSNGTIFVRLTKNKNGKNNIPKGHIKGDETWLDTARREILEETGVVAGDEAIELGEISYEFGDSGNRIKKTVRYYMFVNLSMEARELSLEEGESVSSAEWIKADEANARLEHESERELLAKALDIYGSRA